MFSVAFFREGIKRFSGWLDELLNTAWEACQGTDVLLEAPSAMAGVHIAEKLGIPFFGVFTMPWTRTSAYPHPFATTDTPLGSINAYFKRYTRRLQLHDLHYDSTSFLDWPITIC